MASTNNYINEYATLEEMNAAYESDHSGSWVAYCAEDNNLYYQQKTSISSKYFDNLEYNSENKTLDFYIDGEVKKSIDVSPWWFEKDSYYTREESDAKYINNIGTSGNSLTYTIGDNTNNVTVPYATIANELVTANTISYQRVINDDYHISNAAYVDNDTHIMYLGYFQGETDNMWYWTIESIFVYCNFFGQQHRNIDMLNFYAATNDGGNSYLVEGKHIGGNQREYYYIEEDNKIKIYVKVTGGNAYGYWGTFIFYDLLRHYSRDRWHQVGEHNVSVDLAQMTKIEFV